MNFTSLTDLCHEIEKNVDVFDVANYLEIKRGAGASSFFCPFHEDSKPSFIAGRGRSVWTCASHCGSGNLYQLVQKIKGVGYIDAVKEVASLANLSCDMDFLDKIKQIEKELTPLPERHLNYLLNRGFTKETIQQLNFQAWKGYIVIPNTKNGEILNYKYLPLKKTRLDKNTNKEIDVTHYFRGNDNSCVFFPNNNFKDTEILILVAGEWDTAAMMELIKNNKDGVNYKVISSSAGEKSSPLDIVQQISKRNAPNLREVWVFYDHDKPGKEGAYKIADKMCVLNIPIWIHFWAETNKKGYDVNDFLLDGYTFEDCKKLKKLQYDPRQADVKVTGSDFETERELLLFLLANNKFLQDLYSENIRVSDFKNWRFQEVYKLIVDFIENFGYCNLDLLQHRIHDQNLIEAVNEIAGAREILTVAEFFDHIRLIQVSSFQKLLELSVAQLNRLVNTNIRSIPEIQGKVFEINEKLLTEASYNDKTVSMEEALDNYFDSYAEKETLRYITTPFESMNDALKGGWRVGKCHIVTGEVSLGKSIIGRQQAEHSAFNKVPTMLYVSEATAGEVAENVAANRSDINNYHFKTRILPHGHEPQALRQSIRQGTDKNYLFIKEAFDLEFDDIINDIRMQVRKRKIKLVVLDQLTSIPTQGHGITRKEFITKCMTRLTRLAEKENICILIVSQLKRESQGTGGKHTKKNMFEKASSDDLAESADLERLAYTIVILTSNEKFPDIIRVHFAKNRNYKKGIYTEVIAEKEYSRFKEKSTITKF